MTTRATHVFAPVLENIKGNSVLSILELMRRLLTVGTGIGIEIRGSNLKILVVRITWRGPTFLGEHEILGFDERPPGEWKREYKTFLRQLGISHIGAVILLPHEELSCRTIELPGIITSMIPAALTFEVFSYFPAAKEEPVYDWNRIERSSSILLAMTTRSVVERYAALFKQGDIKVSRFTCDAAALYLAAHMYRQPHPDSFLAIGESFGEQILYGESSSNPLLSRRVDASFETARVTAIGQLRLAPDITPIPIENLFPKARVSPEGVAPFVWSMTYVTALCAWSPWFVKTVNLLPREQRQSLLRSVYLPTMVLLTLLIVAVGGLAWFSLILTESHFHRAVLAAIEAVEPQARKSDDLDRRIATLLARIQTIDAFRMRSKEDLDAFGELTQLITPPTWVRSLLLTRRGLSLIGEAEQAASLLKVIDSSTQFTDSQFSTPVAPAGRLEGFGIRAKRKIMSRETH